MGAHRQQVWQALNDTEVLKATVPGCEQIAWTSDTKLDVAVKVNLGVMAPVFHGILQLSDIDPAQSYVLSGRASGKLLGKAQGAARVTLEDQGAGTLLTFRAEGGASGQLLKLGKPLIGKSVQNVIDHFFQRFADAMSTSLEVLPPPGQE